MLTIFCLLFFQKLPHELGAGPLAYGISIVFDLLFFVWVNYPKPKEAE